MYITNREKTRTVQMDGGVVMDLTSPSVATHGFLVFFFLGGSANFEYANEVELREDHARILRELNNGSMAIILGVA